MIKSENLGRINLNGETFQDLYVEIEPELDTLELMAIFSELKARGYNYEAINKLLKEAGEKLNAVWDIACMLENVNASNRDYKTLIDLISFRLRHLALGYDDYLEEAELYLPEAEEGDPESELEALEDDLQFVTPEDGDKE